MRITSQPLSAILWDAAGVLSDTGDGWLADWIARLDKRGVVQAAFGGAAPGGLPLGRAFDGPANAAGFGAAVAALGVAPGAVLFVGASNAEVNAAAGAGLRSFRYSRLARDVLSRRLQAP